MNGSESNIDLEIRDLLEVLNYWEQTYGTTYAGEARLKSTGEANARISDLKQKLNAKGAIYHWNSQKYVLDTIVDPNQGGQGADELNG